MRQARARHNTCGACGGTRPRCPWAAAGPGRASRRRARQHISDPAPLVWRAPEGPEGTGGLRGAAPNDVRRPSLAGAQSSPARHSRRPEHQRGHKQQHAARTARGRTGHAAVGDQAGQQTTSRKTAAHGRIDQPGPQDSTPGARNTGDRARRPKHQQRHKHRAPARHSKRGRHQPTPCANVLTHP